MKHRKLKNRELGRIGPQEFKESKKIPLRIILDDIRSLNNIGSVFRTADAFRVEKIYLCGITAQPPHKDIQKTALGATDSVDWEYVPSVTELVERLQAEGVQILAIEQAEDTVSLEEFRGGPQQTYAVVFGNEVKGVSQDVVSRADMVIEIPQYGTKHSLNISVSAGIVVWQLFNQLKASLTS